ncbi:MAG: hypothetical protein KDA36_04030 [Planctomycetaceae bacterium]|nr:hypothetical protein [Planctomycetaceae bacterium]
MYQHPWRRVASFHLLISTILVLQCLPAFAGDKSPRTRLKCPEFYKSYSSLLSLQTDLVQTELKLNPAQIAVIRQLQTNFGSDVKRITEEYGQLSAEQQSMRRIHDRIRDAATKKCQPVIDRTLSDEQANRLDQIEWQLFGVDAFRMDALLEFLNASEIQKKRIGKIIQDMEHRFINQPSSDSLLGRIQDKLNLRLDDEKVQKTALKDLLKQLTDEQREIMETQWGTRVDRMEILTRRQPLGISFQYEEWRDGKKVLMNSSLH